MAGGEKQVQFNTFERAVSTDFNRLQTFSGFSLSELAKWMFDAATEEEIAASAVVTGTGVEVPARGAVVNGILPYVPAGVGGTAILVTPGLLFINDFDSPINTDASLYKYVEDLGLTTANPLVFTPNTSGLARVDVIECQRNPAVVLEQDNRDIFNNITGLFTTATVPKVTQDQLTYRIRVGTPGAGYPGSVQGWMPLTIISVPSATTTTLDTCNLWDVRPLLSDMARRPFDISEAAPLTTKVNLARGSSAAAGPYAFLIGVWESILGDRIIGGPIAVEPNAADYQEQGAGPFVQGLPYYIYQATFCGLPRWARYATDPAALRIPLSPRGVTIMTQKGCDVTGAPILPLVAPAITSLLGGSAFSLNARLMYEGFIANSSGDFVGALKIDKEVDLDDELGTTRAIPMVQNTLSATQVSWGGVDNIHWPGNATHARVRFETAMALTDLDNMAFKGSPISLFDVSFTQSSAYVASAAFQVSGESVITYPLGNVPRNAIVTELRVWVKAASVGGSLPGTMPTIQFQSTNPVTGAVVVLGSATDTSGSVGAFETQHDIVITGLSVTISEFLEYEVALSSGEGISTGTLTTYGANILGTGLQNASGSFSVKSYDTTQTFQVWSTLGDYVFAAGQVGNPTHIFEAWIPLYPNVTGSPTTRNFLLTYGLGVTISSAAAYVVGWRTR
jgi:hypothetical protein